MSRIRRICCGCLVGLFVAPMSIHSVRVGDVATADPVVDQVKAVLGAQVRAWNAGDIDAFLETYWKSDQLTFSSGGTTTRGWGATKARYQQRYATRQAMGQLAFDHLEVSPLGNAAALVLGEWHLKRDTESLDGNFSLVLRHIDGRWVIIHDHTSLRPADVPH